MLTRNEIIFQRASCRDMVCIPPFWRPHAAIHKLPQRCLLGPLLCISFFISSVVCLVHFTLRQGMKTRLVDCRCTLSFVGHFSLGLCRSFTAPFNPFLPLSDVIPFNLAPLLFSEQLNGPYTHTCCCL